MSDEARVRAPGRSAPLFDDLVADLGDPFGDFTERESGQDSGVVVSLDAYRQRRKSATSRGSAVRR